MNKAWIASFPMPCALCLAVLLPCGAATSGPARVWTRLRGSALSDWGNAVATDSRSNIYVCGSNGGALDGQTNIGQVLVKWNAAGEWVWTRTLGGEDAEPYEALGLAVDTQDSVYVCGEASLDFDGHVHPAPGTYMATLVKFHSDGAKQWSLLFGSTNQTSARAVVCDTNFNVYVTGITYGPFDGQASWGGMDPFLWKCDGDGNWKWTRIWGTGGMERAFGLADWGSNIYVGGDAELPFDGQPGNGLSDVFLTLWRADGTKQWSHLFGTPSNDYASAVASLNDAVALCGDTFGAWTGYTNKGRRDAFVLVFDAEGTLRRTIMFGGTNQEYTAGVALSADGICVAGEVWPGSSWGGEPAPDAFCDMFLEARKWNGTTNWTRFWGGPEADYAGQIAVSAEGAIYVPSKVQSEYDGQTITGYFDMAVSRYEPLHQIQVSTLSVEGNLPVVRWRGAYDWTYDLMQCEDLIGGSWAPVAGQTNLPGGEAMCATGQSAQALFCHPRANR